MTLSLLIKTEKKFFKCNYNNKLNNKDYEFFCTLKLLTNS